MPLLTELATVISGKTKTQDAQKGLYALRRTLPQEELSLAARLRTQLVVGSESTCAVRLPSNESRGVFASWRSELERTPQYDLCEKTPLNTVKDGIAEAVEEYKAFEREQKHKQWLRGVDERMRKLGFKP